MGHIREIKLKNGNVRFRAEVRLKGHPCVFEPPEEKTI